MDRLQPGQIFAGYTVEALLGTGGTGDVYLVRHPRLPRSDVLKVLATRTVDDDAVRGFEREIDAVAGLSHPNIVGIHDRGEDDGRPWIAYQRIDGQDLGARIRQGRIDPAVAARYVREIAGALDEAAGQGLVHRDVAPANILIDHRDRALLTGFGIAPPSTEATGTTIDTVTFASPEQLLGLPLDARTDQYSLACTAYALLTGAPPFDGGTVASLIMAHVQHQPPRATGRAPALPPAVDSVLATALAKNPADRYPTSRAFADALTAALSPYPAGYGPAGPAPVGYPGPQGVLQPPPPPAQTNKMLTVLLILGAAFVMVAVLVVVLVVILLPGEDGQEDGDDVLARAREVICLPFTYRYDTVQADMDAAAATMTGQAAERFEQARSTTVELITQSKSSSTCEVASERLESQSADTASIRAVLHITGETPGRSADSRDHHLHYTMTKSDGRWLVSGFELAPETPPSS